MKQSDMSADAIADRQVFIEHLSAAGWMVETWDEVLDAGADVEPEAEAEYSGTTFDLRLEYYASNRSLVFQLADENSISLFLRLFPVDLKLVLGPITAVQDELNETNYMDFVKSLITLCTLVLIETEEGSYRLSTDPDNPQQSIEG